MNQQHLADGLHKQELAATRTSPIEVSGLNLSFKDRHVLKDLDLCIPQGAVVGVVGANGAGKTSLMRCLLGLTLPQSGQIRLLGENPQTLSHSARARLGYVAQTPELVDWMRVGHYLDYIAAFYPVWRSARVEAWRRAWDLDIDQKISVLSLGQKQKLALLQALGHAPELLLLDEPVASLDPLMRRDFMRSLFDDGQLRTVLISSHLLSDLERIITHLVLMKNGRIVLAEEWDVITEYVQRVQLTRRLPEAPGLLAQHVCSEGLSAVIDTRLFDLSLLPSDAHRAPMNLDTLFVELVS
ncbi:MAG: ABC-2 type transport system ATP-binding protein [Comamonadaceae bacterium]|nr:MAG: ABC-2 type transport system ATP-binding protein [Comamonadaceae bacterium]